MPQPSGTEELEELTSDATMLKREPLQVSAEELSDNTELEQAKEVLRDEYSQAQDEDNDRVSETK